MTNDEIIRLIESRRLEPNHSTHHNECRAAEDYLADCECRRLEREDRDAAAEAKWDAEREG